MFELTRFTQRTLLARVQNQFQGRAALIVIWRDFWASIIEEVALANAALCLTASALTNPLQSQQTMTTAVVLFITSGRNGILKTF